MNTTACTRLFSQGCALTPNALRCSLRESPRLPWRVHVDLTIPKGGQQAEQQLHRDGDLSLLDFQGQLEHAVSVIWALDGDFTNASPHHNVMRRAG